MFLVKHSEFKALRNLNSHKSENDKMVNQLVNLNGNVSEIKRMPTFVISNLIWMTNQSFLLPKSPIVFTLKIR